MTGRRERPPTDPRAYPWWMRALALLGRRRPYL